MSEVKNYIAYLSLLYLTLIILPYYFCFKKKNQEAVKTKAKNSLFLMIKTFSAIRLWSKEV